jgi:glycosyltransferase involved in cell wall biosynthesis
MVETIGRPNAASATLPDVSVVVCTHSSERRAMLGDLLVSIWAGSLQPREIVLVVDRNPKLLEELRAEAWPLPIRVLESNGAGLAAARNTGWRAAAADLIAFTDDDAIASRRWLETLVSASGEHQAGILGGRIDPRWANNQPVWYSPRLGWIVGCTYEGLPTVPSLVRNVIGCNMLIRRDVLERLEGFHPDLGRKGANLDGAEETELCIRANALGERVVFIPAAPVEQVLSRSRATMGYAIRRSWSEGRSKRRLARLHGHVLAVERHYALDVLRSAFVGLVRGVIARRPGEVVRALSLVVVLATASASYLIHGLDSMLMSVGKPMRARS